MMTISVGFLSIVLLWRHAEAERNRAEQERSRAERGFTDARDSFSEVVELVRTGLDTNELSSDLLVARIQAARSRFLELADSQSLDPETWRLLATTDHILGRELNLRARGVEARTLLAESLFYWEKVLRDDPTDQVARRRRQRAAAELRFGQFTERFPLREIDHLGADDWANRVAGFLPSSSSTDGVGPSDESRLGYRITLSLSARAVVERRTGKLNDARQTADRIHALAKLIVARYPDQPAAHLCLAEAYSQRAKNAWRPLDRGAVERNWRWPSTKRAMRCGSIPAMLGSNALRSRCSTGSTTSVRRRMQMRHRVALFRWCWRLDSDRRKRTATLRRSASVSHDSDSKVSARLNIVRGGNGATCSGRNPAAWTCVIVHPGHPQMRTCPASRASGFFVSCVRCAAQKAVDRSGAGERP